MFPKPTEQVILTVNGRDFTEWESVMVRHAMRDIPPYHCRFTCSEGTPIAENFAKMQVKPGDTCTVLLAGQPAFHGKVETRQVYYDASRHHIEIQCATFSNLATGSVISRSGEWRDKTFQQIGESILGPIGIRMIFEGGPPPSYKFPRASVTPGESIYDFLDMLARSLSPATGVGISFTTNTAGDFVVVMGPNGATDSVTEGKDILIGREIVYNPSMAGYLPTMTQGTGGDQRWGANVASLPFFSTSQTSPFAASSTPAIIRSEMASSDRSFLRGRAASESQWQGADQVTVFVTVKGWLRPSGGLWQRNQQVTVTSPMLMMNGNVLRAKAVTFTQDDKTGTRTLLELCNPAAMGPGMPGTVQ